MLKKNRMETIISKELVNYTDAFKFMEKRVEDIINNPDGFVNWGVMGTGWGSGFKKVFSVLLLIELVCAMSIYYCRPIAGGTSRAR